MTIVLCGAWYTEKTLILPARLSKWFGNIFQFMVVLVITWFFVRLFNAIFTNYIKPLASKTETDLNNQLLPILCKSIKMSIWAIGIIVSRNNARYDVAALLAGLGIGGLAFAIAAKDTVTNIFSGFTIITDAPFKLGDRIKAAGLMELLKISEYEVHVCRPWRVGR